MFNLHPLFHGSFNVKGFNARIVLSPEDRNTLRNARDIIRSALRDGLPALIKANYPKFAKIPTPKFHTQGSWAYNTILSPAHPGQQSDMDDGCYLPLSFLKGAQPEIASKFFFAAVETVLKPVALAHGWTINPGGPKPTCTRVEINEWMHIDIPLYAIPDTEFEKLSMIFAEARQDAKKAMSLGDAWTLLPKDSLLLAHREEGWKPSDPRPMKDWLERQVMLKTEQLRRVIRYVKAWRDNYWKNGNAPSSILLMTAVDLALPTADARDDLALLKVAEKLPAILSGNVANPTAEELLSDKLDDDKIRNEVVMAVRLLHSALHEAIMRCDRPEDACRRLQQLFGTRFPTDLSAIEHVKAVAVVTAAAPRKIEREPVVGRSTSG